MAEFRMAAECLQFRSESKCAATDADIQKFNELLKQIIGELDIILKNIADRNYVALASKHGFMEIRYSDKF